VGFRGLIDSKSTDRPSSHYFSTQTKATVALPVRTARPHGPFTNRDMYLYSTSDLPWDRKAFKIRREDIIGEFILVFFVLSLYLDRTERERDRGEREREDLIKRMSNAL